MPLLVRLTRYSRRKERHEKIDEAIRVHDRILLVLSDHSMSSVSVEKSNLSERVVHHGVPSLYIRFPFTPLRADFEANCYCRPNSIGFYELAWPNQDRRDSFRREASSSRVVDYALKIRLQCSV